MMLNVFTAAMLLVGGTFVSPEKVSNTFNVAETSVSVSYNSGIPSNIVTILVENHAAPHWNLSLTEAWYQYNIGAMVITRMGSTNTYSIRFDDGILEITLEESGT